MKPLLKNPAAADRVAAPALEEFKKPRIRKPGTSFPIIPVVCLNLMGTGRMR